ncbi:hypothetical protein CR513_10782, partial [Mucuna pruriens]
MYFPPSKSNKLKKGHHELLSIFYNGLSTLNQTNIDAAYEGMIKKKSPSEAYAIIEDITSNTNHYSSSDSSCHPLLPLVSNMGPQLEGALQLLLGRTTRRPSLESLYTSTHAILELAAEARRKEAKTT